ncbi:hypothetical protein CLV24_113124 [Pontibacter ummariensis]|uniref:Uncharacterized protein n=1 Tax=Pontibacter ummariensis TaxID=1610492 RepID=A0A239H9K7_9BACT|nr:hypothetical protein [Pontibacter ummariensis]PRY10705.1 hypothetical protein CLV24_113124 [Pontibacter ummariensis]SNS77748.1 hypothetical protein SAMN06296052_11331 [Pontibacter ummariensis]
MKSFLYITFLYLCLSLLAVSCSESAPQPAEIQAEVVAQDCEQGWYILKLEEGPEADQSGAFVGQLHGGYVTTDNLPEAYRQMGQRLSVALELNGEQSPRCPTVYRMYPTVKVMKVSQVSSDNR